MAYAAPPTRSGNETFLLWFLWDCCFAFNILFNNKAKRSFIFHISSGAKIGIEDNILCRSKQYLLMILKTLWVLVSMPKNNYFIFLLCPFVHWRWNLLVEILPHNHPPTYINWYYKITSIAMKPLQKTKQSKNKFMKRCTNVTYWPPM